MSRKALEMEHLPISGLRMRRRGGSLIGDSERHVKEGFGNGEALSLQTLRDRNPEGVFLYRGLPETCNRRFGKRSISFYNGSIRGTYRHLARDGSVNMFIAPEPVLDIIFCYI
jgi:hypothetical protein